MVLIVNSDFILFIYVLIFFLIVKMKPYRTEWTIQKMKLYVIIKSLAYTDVCEMAGLARSINTQPAVRRNSETNPTSQHNRGMY